MMKLVLGGLLIVATSQVSAVGSLDDLKKVCDFPATTKESKLINATAFLAPAGLVQYNVSSNTYSVTTVAFTKFPPPDNGPICPSSLFYGEDSVIAGRTGFLIAPNIIMTAPHVSGSSFNPQQFVVIFRHSQQTAGGAGCTNFTWSSIPRADVYFPNSSTAVVNTLDASGRYDYAAFTLDRSVINRAPVKIRRSGTPRLGDVLISAGYPERTSERVDSAVIYDGIGSTTGLPVFVTYPGNYLLANLNSFAGDSGSPVYNSSDDVVEAAVAYGLGATFTQDLGATCSHAISTGYTSDTNGTITDIASQIPRYEVLVTPLNYVVHVSALGAATDQPLKTYSITPVVGGSSVVTLSPIQGPTGSVTTTPVIAMDTVPGVYSLPANGKVFHINASTSGLTHCGRWDYQMNVHDNATGGDNIIRHRFEVGLVEISATSQEDWIDNDIGSPYEKTRTYTIKNTRPTATTVQVYAGGDLPANVVTINGAGATTVALGPAGSPTDTKTIVIGISANADAVATVGTVYNLFVAFANMNYTCAAQDVPLRYIHFKRGERKFESVQGAALLAAPASGQTLGAATRYDVDLSSIGNYCVGDLNLDAGFPSPGLGLLAEVPEVQITLKSPSGKTGVLWAQNAYPGGAYGIIDNPEDLYVPFLHLDDQLSPPLGPKHLSFFNAQHLTGHWFIDVRASSTFDVVGPIRLDFTTGSCVGLGP